MLDTEFERMEAGWLLEEKKMHRLDDEDEGGFSPKHLQQTTMGITIWDYIDKHHRKTPLFYNFLYSPGDHEVVGQFLYLIDYLVEFRFYDLVSNIAVMLRSFPRRKI